MSITRDQRDFTVSRRDAPGASPVQSPRATRSRSRVRVGLIVRCRATALDRRLAAGAQPSDELLAHRARVLTTARSRRRLAAGLARTLRDAAQPEPWFSAVAVPDREEVLSARIVIEVLCRRLRSDASVHPRGTAMLELLLTDPQSALYCRFQPGALDSELRAAAAALDPSEVARRTRLSEISTPAIECLAGP